MKKSRVSQKSQEALLLEIGTEELPLDALEKIRGELANLLRVAFEEARLSFGQIRVETTPRRVVVFVSNLPREQSPETLEAVGPSYAKAYDEQGKPTEALLGFLRSKNLKERDVVVKELPKGKYVVCRKVTRGKSLSESLPQIIVETLKRVSFPKNMIWEPSQFRFPRPVRWILALVDDRVLSFTIGGVKADRLSRGHRFLAPRKLAVRRAEWTTFTSSLRKAHVVVELEKRMALIRQGVQKRSGNSSVDPELVQITAQLVEEPFLISGDFEPEFLKLPQEILATCMKKNQRIFPVYDVKGNLKAQFIAVLNGRRSRTQAIATDYRRVLEARLRDALFFYQEDAKEPLENKLAPLRDVIFLGKLGTVYEKVERLISASEPIGKSLNLSSVESQNLIRSGKLCKADLLTHMVYEFPELQGIMGREYAKLSHEREEVCRAISDHYLPRNLSEPYKELEKYQTRLGAILSILDRMDTLVGAFGIGLEPSGSEDPYALRRASGGIVKILRAFGFRFDLLDLAEKMYQAYGGKMTLKFEGVRQKLENFFKERVIFELGLKPGTREEEIARAVLKSGWTDLANAFLRFQRLKALFHENRALFKKTYKVIERTHNILKVFSEKGADPIREDLLREPLEKKLHELACEKEPSLGRLIREEKFDEATRLYGETFHEVVHEFFDKVLVNVEDPMVRGNRQALMRKINRLYVDKIADLSLVTHLD